MTKTILACLAALTLLSASAPAARAQEDKGAPRGEEVAARLKKARDENRRVIVKFKNGVSVTGRVGEVRERGFTFEPNNADDALYLKAANSVAAILYEDVAAVRHPSKLRKFFRGVRIGLVGTGALFIVMPIYAVDALLGRLPSC